MMADERRASIELTHGYIAFTDQADIDLADFNYHTVKNKRSRTYYAARSILAVNGRYKRVFMHREILARMLNRPLLPNEEVDHVDGNGLNNCRSNLRLASSAQNKRNISLPRHNTSGYKGVRASKGYWRAVIRFEGRTIHIGHYDTAELAAIAYNHEAKHRFGSFAKFNDIPGWECVFPEPRKQSSHLRKSNRTGYVGVSFDKLRNKYIAMITRNGKQKNLGRFDTPESAHEAYCKAAESEAA